MHIQAGQCGNQIGTKVGPGARSAPAGGQLGSPASEDLALRLGARVTPRTPGWGPSPGEPALCPRGQTRGSSPESGPPVPAAGSRDPARSGPPVPAAESRECAPGTRPGEWATGPEGRALESWPRGVAPTFLRPGPVTRPGEGGPRVSADRPGITIQGMHPGLRARGAGSTELATGPGAAGGGVSPGGGGSLGSGSDSLSLGRSLASFGK